MINLNELTEDNNGGDVKIFNNGTAGKVKNVRVEVTKKTPEDKPTSPDFKINYIDENGGMVNDGIYYPKEGDTEKQKQISLSRLLSVLHAIAPETKGKSLPEFDDYKPAMDFLIKQISLASKEGSVNVFVAYGTNIKPSQYLRVRKFRFVESTDTEDNTSRLTASLGKGDWDDVMERITPTEFNETSFDSNKESEDDLDW